MQECGATQIGQDAYWLVDLDYLGVIFEGKIDTTFRREDYYILRSQWLKQLRDNCMARWETYFRPKFQSSPAGESAKTTE